MGKMKGLLALLLVLAGPSSASLAGEQWPEEAVLVLRVERLSVDSSADKYAWYNVRILKALKNGTDAQVPATLRVAAFSWKPGVPNGVSTIYLERYHPDSPLLWRLVGGEAATGVARN